MFIALGCLLTIATLGVAGAFAWGAAQLNNIDRVDVALHAAGLDQPQNFLIVGSDTRDVSREGDAGGIFGGRGEVAPPGQRSDSIVVARIDSSRGAVELLSIPRDLWVLKPGGSGEHQRINAAYNDGPQALIDSVEANLGIEVNHFVEVNFDGFKGLVEAIGGVPMYFDKPLRDANTGLRITKTGCQVLDPTQALAYARSRYLEYSNGRSWVSDPTGDLGRITRQQVFVRRALAKVSTLGIGDINTLRKLVGVGVNAVTIDSALGIDEMVGLARRFSAFSSEQLVTHRLPTTDHTTDGGAQVELLDSAGAGATLDLFRGRTEMVAQEVTTTTLPASSITVDVLNATKTKGIAKKDADLLATHGFKVGSVGNAAATSNPGTAATTIRYAAGFEAAAHRVADTMTPAPPIAADPTLKAGTVQLIIGVDVGTVASGTGGVAASVPSSPATTAPAADPADTRPVGVAPGDPPPGVVCE